jgi:hypothetical protein
MKRAQRLARRNLGLEAPDPARWTRHVVIPSGRDCLAPDKRLLHVVAERNRWQATLTGTKSRARELTAVSREG